MDTMTRPALADLTPADHARLACRHPETEHTCWYACEHPGSPCRVQDPATAWDPSTDSFRCPAHTPGQAMLPDLYGKVEGIVGLDPFTIQCRGCGVKDTAATVGLSDPRRATVVVLSRIRFHPTTWTTEHTDNPRLCATCRMGRGCQCHGCKEERRGA